MASRSAPLGPHAVPESQNISSPATSGAIPDSRRLNFELGVSLSLHRWPALTLAVNNGWGGPDSQDKRLWFAGAISQLFEERAQSLDIADLEDMLLQVMLDEFGVALEDDSEIEVAARIWQYWVETGEGHYEGVQSAWRQWSAKGFEGMIVRGEKGGEESEDDDEEEWGGIEEDTDMGEAPPLSEIKEKPRPEVDDEGFTMVKARKKR